MFNFKQSKTENNMAKGNDYDAKSVNTICAGKIVKGDITSDGDFRIVGRLIGTIQSKGKVVIGKSGSVEGDVFCKNADISGVIVGSMKVDELLILTSSSRVEGQVTVGKISIEAGANFSGQCNMNNANAQGKGKS